MYLGLKYPIELPPCSRSLFVLFKVDGFGLDLAVGGVDGVEDDAAGAVVADGDEVVLLAEGDVGGALALGRHNLDTKYQFYATLEETSKHSNENGDTTCLLIIWDITWKQPVTG